MTPVEVARAVDARMPMAEALFAAMAEKSRDGEGITRKAWSAEDQAAADLIAEEARAAGLEVEYDHAGNLYATLPGRDRAAPGILMASHVDSVPKGGNYDGAAGVVAGLAAITALKDLGHAPPHDLTVMATRGEESVWYSIAYVGSRLATGDLPLAELDTLKRLDTGRSLADHIADLGFDVEALRAQPTPRISKANTKAYFELHIEQGPLLEGEGIPLGIATAIRGNARHPFARCLGEYTHSAAVPRAYRSDAVLATVELVGEIDALWQRLEAEGVPDLVFTVGQFSTDAQEHAMTKVPGECAFTLNFGGTTKDTLDMVRARMPELAAEIGARRRVRFELGPGVGSDPTLLDPALRAELHGAAEALSIPAMDMATVGHDASVFIRAGIPAAMVMVRNQHGSHNAAEAMEMSDFALGTQVLATALLRVG